MSNLYLTDLRLFLPELGGCSKDWSDEEGIETCQVEERQQRRA
jgi:hypothetical protein